MTIQKISFATLLTVMLFAAAFSLAGTVLADTTGGGGTGCEGCGGGGGTGTGGGETGGGGGGTPIVVAPTCDIKTNITSVVAGGAYTITWNVVSVTAVNVYINGAHVNKSGSATYNFKDTNNTETFNLTAQNAGGRCADSVVVTKKVPTVTKPTCDISTNISSVVAGGAYTISWNGTPSTGTTFKVNGTVVDPVDSATYNFKPVNNTETYTFTGTNSGGTCTDQVTVTKKVVDPIKSCDVTASATSVASGSSVTLTWKTVGFSTITINGVPVTGANGSKTYTNIQSDTTYTLVAKTADGTGSCTATVVVKCVPPTVILPKCDSFTAAPITINRGETTKLTWTTTNAQSVSINNGVGPVALDGDITVTPLESVTYTLTARRDDGRQVTCAVPVTVVPPSVPLPKCDSFTAEPSTINRGEESTLTWNTTNAESVTINNGIGTKSADGSIKVTPQQTTTYNLVVKAADGRTVNCPAKVVTVRATEPVFTCSNNVNLSASPTSFRRGESSTITWSTNDVTSVRFNNGITATGLSGSVSVSPDSDQTYVMTVSNGSKTIDCPISVNVTTSGGGGGGGTPTPRCTLKISDEDITKGERVTLKWDTSNATEITIKDNHGKTLVTTEDRTSSDKRDLYDGEITLRPDSDTTYTLVAERGSRDKTCKVEVDVKDGITVIENRDQQPLVTGIALTQVPYTGFEAGAFLTTLFYSLLAMFAAYLAYIFVIRRDSVAVAGAAILTDTVHTAQVFANPTSFTPNFHQAAPVVASTATIGYAAAVATEVSDIEARAHAEMILLSADALAQLAAATDASNVSVVTADVFAKAKAAYPTEDGYVSIGLERLNTLLG